MQVCHHRSQVFRKDVAPEKPMPRHPSVRRVVRVRLRGCGVRFTAVASQGLAKRVVIGGVNHRHRV